MEEYQLSFQTLRVYPRVYYFATRLKSLLPRLARVTNKLPGCFQKDLSHLQKKLIQLNKIFEGGVIISDNGATEQFVYLKQNTTRSDNLKSDETEETEENHFEKETEKVSCALRISGLADNTKETLTHEVEQLNKQTKMEGTKESFTDGEKGVEDRSKGKTILYGGTKKQRTLTDNIKENTDKTEKSADDEEKIIEEYRYKKEAPKVLVSSKEKTMSTVEETDSFFDCQLWIKNSKEASSRQNQSVEMNTTRPEISIKIENIKAPFSLEHSDEGQNVLEMQATVTHCTTFKDKDDETSSEEKFTAKTIEDLHREISDYLEREVVRGLVEIFSFLQQFEPVSTYSSSTGEDKISKSTPIAKAIQNFLHATQMELGKEKRRNIHISQFIAEIQKGLARSVKCAAVEPFSNKYDLNRSICNTLLHELQFENSLIYSVRKTIRNWVIAGALKYKLHPRKFPKKLKRIIEMLFQMTEEKFSTFRTLSLIVKKMNFEVLGYLRKSVDKTAKTIFREYPLAARIDDTVRTQLHSIKGVTGVGTIYGKLEIHIDREELPKCDVEKEQENDTNYGIRRGEEHKVTQGQKVKHRVQQRAEEEQKLRIQECKRSIHDCLVRNGYAWPYSLKWIIKQPRTCMACLPGSPVRGTTSDRTGTLGGYFKLRDRLHALTCAHVVGDSEKAYVNYLNTPFSTNIIKHHSGAENFPFIDIAALEVCQNIHTNCQKKIEKDCRNIAEVNLSVNPPVSYASEKVYKFGAVTDFTEGIILADDYSCYFDRFGKNALQYIILIGQESNVSDDLEANWGPLGQLSKGKSVVHVKRKEEKERSSQLPVNRVLYDRTSATAAVRTDRAATGNDANYAMSNEAQTVYPMESSSKCVRLDEQKLVVKTVYVRDIHSNPCESNYKEFCKRGDSGSIVCIQDSKHLLKHSALSMIAAGEYEVEDHPGKLCLSFMLSHALDVLLKKKI